ncbi:MAG: single-stranded-DNA-specific exonuclease RecJ [Armatimonadota bacterium]
MAATSAPPAARWRRLPADIEGSTRLAALLGINPLVAQVLINRGLRDPEAARSFLDTRLERLSSPFALAQMDRVVDRLVRAIREHTPIVIYGDYDADGVTSTALLVRVLRQAGAAVDFYVPDRQGEGYGLHAAAVARLAADGAGLLVAVDCGITAVAAADAARAAGVDLIILDHHTAVGTLPQAYAIVNPRLTAGSSDFCAAGLAFQVCRGVRGAFGLEEIEPDLIGLAALGTVADAVRLTGDNRIIVSHGLQALGEPAIQGLRALLDVAGAEPPLHVRAISHGLAPRINAAGRLAHAATAVRLLVSDDADECREIAAALDRLNQERRALCDQVLAEAIEEVEAGSLDDHPALVLAREGWHPGVMGIVASQLVERYYRPAILIAVKGGVAKGSARSIPSLHLVDALSTAAGELTAYGGHALAAGLALPAEAIPRFRATFLDIVGSRLQAEDLLPTIQVDAEVDLEHVTPHLAAEVDRLAPFGSGNDRPVFLTRGLRAIGTRLVGDGTHLRLVVSDGSRTAEAIAFRLGERAELLAFTQARVDLAYAVEPDRWRDSPAPQLVVEHLWTPDVDLAAIAADTAGVLARLFDRSDDYLDGRGSDIEDAPAFHTKLVGVTFEGRQALLPLVRAGDRLRLVRDPGNPRDPHAIKVCVDDARQLGFVRAELAAHLAPAIDAGARYTATATALTGGGDRAWGLNILVERDAIRSGAVDEPLRPLAQRPAGPEFLNTLAARLLRGRLPTAGQRQVLDVLLAGEPVAARFGPGRGLVSCVVMAATALIARRDGPVAIVLPRVTDVEAWYGLARPWLRGLGMRAAAAHGVQSPRGAARLNRALEGGELDLMFASAAWMQWRAPSVQTVIAVVDSLSFDDVQALGPRYGGRIRFITGPGPQGQLRETCRAFGMERFVVDPSPRTNLRIVDHRGRGEPDLMSGTGVRREKVLCISADARSSVAEARRLRERYADRDGPIAYYHDGLPAALRHVLEDLYAAGKITTLVGGTLLVDPSLPGDVSRVIALSLPSTRLLAAEGLGAAGLDGRIAVTELCYGPGEIAAIQARLETRYPSREILVRCYQQFRALNADGPWAWPATQFKVTADTGPSPDTMTAALGIFVEAGVVSQEGAEGSPSRYALIDPSARVDLERSLRYREGLRERAAWTDLRVWATGPASAILADLAGP